MLEIINEDACKDTYGRIRMYQALILKQHGGVDIPSERTIYRVMEELGLVTGRSVILEELLKQIEKDISLMT